MITGQVTGIELRVTGHPGSPARPGTSRHVPPNLGILILGRTLKYAQRGFKGNSTYEQRLVKVHGEQGSGGMWTWVPGGRRK
jgi:hypothetical protein